MLENNDLSQNQKSDTCGLVLSEIIGKTHLFTGLEFETLEKITAASRCDTFDFGEIIWNRDRQEDWNKEKNKSKKTETCTPLMIVASGCAAVTQSAAASFETQRLNALVMPYQLIGEFQFLGDTWPTDIAIKAFDKTRIVFVDPNTLKEIAIAHCSVVYKNLAETLKEKLNIANYHFLITDGKDVLPKLALFLDKVFRIPGWDLACKIDKGNNSGNINILWNYKALGHLLNSGGRSVKEPLNTLVSKGIISLQYFDRDMKPIKLLKPSQTNKAYFTIRLNNRKALVPYLENKR